MKSTLLSVLFAVSCISSSFAEPPTPDYAITFSDDFEGANLDTTKWSLYGEGKRDVSLIVRDAISLDGEGNLQITMRKDGSDYRTGMLSTVGKFSQKFGYFEAKIKMHSVKGPHGAFWLQSNDPDGVEIDIIEWLQKAPQTAYHTIHWDNESGDKQKTVKEGKVRSADRRFRTYGLEWSEKGYTFYVDDKKSATIEGPVSNVQQFIVLSLILNDWGKPADDRDLPDSMLIDYVRVYAKK